MRFLTPQAIMDAFEAGVSALIAFVIFMELGVTEPEYIVVGTTFTSTIIRKLLPW